MYGKQNQITTNKKMLFLTFITVVLYILVAYKKLKFLMNHLEQFTCDIFKNATK